MTAREPPTNEYPLQQRRSTSKARESHLYRNQRAPKWIFLPALRLCWRGRSGDLAARSRYFEGGGIGKALSAVPTHLSPSSINMIGISSTMGYLRPQSLQINHASLRKLSSPPVERTQFGHRRISFRFASIMEPHFSIAGNSTTA